MGFLDKINAAKNPAAAADKKVNPLLKKAAPVVAAVAPAEVPAAPAPAATPSVVAKPNPLAMKKATPAATPAADAPKKTLTLPFKKPATPAPVEEAPAPAEVVTEAPVAAEEPTVEAPVITEAEDSAEAPVVPTEEAQASVQDEKKTAKRTSSRSSAKKPTTDKAEAGTATDVNTAEEEAEGPLPTTTMSFGAAAAALTSPFADTDWDAFKEEIEGELDAIVIDQSMNPGVLKVTLSELNMVYDKIAQPLHETKTLLDNLTNKEDGTIVVIKSVSLGKGNNDMERKRAGFLAAMQYKPKSGGGNINLFEAAAEVRSRYNFLKSVYDRLKYKSDMLITMNGALKLERDFASRGDNT